MSESETQYFTVEEVASHNTFESAWVIIDNKVYDVTQFIAKHPGGSESFSKDILGTDITNKVILVDTHIEKRKSFQARLTSLEIGCVKTN